MTAIVSPRPYRAVRRQESAEQMPRRLHRRLRTLAALDADFEQVIHARDERRRHGAGVTLRRLAERHVRPSAAVLDEAVDVLYTLTSFETFDTLAPTAPRRTSRPSCGGSPRASLALDEPEAAGDPP